MDNTMASGSHQHAGSGTSSEGVGHSVFHGGFNETLLFSSFVIASQSDLAVACMVVGILGILYEGLKLFVTKVQIHSTTRPPSATHKTVLLGVLQTTSYIFYLFLSYCLMLIFMSLNTWLCLSLLLGAGLGHVIFQFQPLHNKLFRRRKISSDDDVKSEVTTVYGANGQSEKEDGLILHSMHNSNK